MQPVPKIIEPTEQQRKQVEAFVGYGATEVEIAALLGMSKTTLRKHFAAELASGHMKTNMRVAESLFAQAVGRPAQYDAAGRLLREEQKPVTTAAIFWAKTRMGWNENAYHLPTPSEPKPPKLGKKEEAAIAAANPDTGTPMGNLMARRAGMLN